MLHLTFILRGYFHCKDAHFYDTHLTALTAHDTTHVNGVFRKPSGV